MKKERIAQKQTEAVARQKARSNRTSLQQLKKLDEKFGVGKGAVKERAKLQKEIKDEKKKANLEKV